MPLAMVSAGRNTGRRKIELQQTAALGRPGAAAFFDTPLDKMAGSGKLGLRSNKSISTGDVHASLTSSPINRSIFARTNVSQDCLIAARETAEGNFDPGTQVEIPRDSWHLLCPIIYRKFVVIQRFLNSFFPPPLAWKFQAAGVSLSLCDSKIAQGGFLWPFAESVITRASRSTEDRSGFASNTPNAGVPNAGVFLWAKSFARCARTAWRRSAGRWRPEIPTSSTRERFWTLTKCAARAFTKANFSSMKPSRWFFVASWRRSKRSTARKEGGPLSYPSHSTKSARPLKSVRLASIYPGGPNPPRGRFF